MTGAMAPLVQELIREKAETEIRMMANGVVNDVRVRNDHPSYGAGKQAIRLRMARIEGAVGLLSMLTGQASHADMPSLYKFTDDLTREQVRKARAMVGGL